MPRAGWSTVAVRTSYHKQLQRDAAAAGRSVSNYLERQLLEKKIIKPAEAKPQ